MIIYRIEHKRTGKGPYRHGRQRVSPYNIYGDPYLEDRLNRGVNKHPTPREEGLGRTDHDLCGFTSVRQLDAWFEDTIWAIFDLGYRVSIYSVPRGHTKRGRKQCLFDSRHAELIDIL